MTKVGLNKNQEPSPRCIELFTSFLAVSCSPSDSRLSHRAAMLCLLLGNGDQAYEYGAVRSWGSWPWLQFPGGPFWLCPLFDPGIPVEMSRLLLAFKKVSLFKRWQQFSFTGQSAGHAYLVGCHLEPIPSLAVNHASLVTFNPWFRPPVPCLTLLEGPTTRGALLFPTRCHMCRLRFSVVQAIVPDHDGRLDGNPIRGPFEGRPIGIQDDSRMLILSRDEIFGTFFPRMLVTYMERKQSSVVVQDQKGGIGQMFGIPRLG